MNFLADESCAGPVIHALREAGHDVVAIAEVAKGIVDELVMARAFGEGRILITEDPDFGGLAQSIALRLAQFAAITKSQSFTLRQPRFSRLPHVFQALGAEYFRILRVQQT